MADLPAGDADSRQAIESQARRIALKFRDEESEDLK
jgi:hypothetical protein